MDSGKTQQHFDGVTLLWCFSKPAYCTLVASWMPNETKHQLAATRMIERTTFFSRWFSNEVAEHAALRACH